MTALAVPRPTHGGAPRVVPGVEVETSPEPVLAEDVRVWWDPATGALRLGVRTAGLGLVAALEPHQVDELAAALLDESPVPHELADLMDDDGDCAEGRW